MDTKQLLIELEDNAWVFEAISNHDKPGELTYTVKATCGVQARGRYAVTDKCFITALRTLHEVVTNEWSPLA